MICVRPMIYMIKPPEAAHPLGSGYPSAVQILMAESVNSTLICGFYSA